MRNLFICGPYPVCNAGLAAWCTSIGWNPRFEADLLQLPARLKETTDGAAILDLDWVDTYGLDTFRSVIESAESNPIWILMDDLRSNNNRIVKALGATGYLLRRATEECMREVLDIASRPSAVTASHADRAWLRKFMKNSPYRCWGMVTPRENDVLANLLRGETNQGIARRLQISPDTVKEHIENIFAKLLVNDRTQAALVVERNSWFSSAKGS